MGPNSFGLLLKMTTFGESHGPGIGLVLDGVPPGLALDLDAIQKELDRRRPGQSDLTTPRNERDRIEVLSGLYDGMTTGAPLTLFVANKDHNPSAYDDIAHLFRPGHADLTMLARYGIRDPRGSGRISGRETLARVAAGAVARQILADLGVEILGAVERIAGVQADLTHWDRLARTDPLAAKALTEKHPTRCPDPGAAEEMAQAIRDASAEGDSVGGVVVVEAVRIPAGLGDPVFGKLDGLLGWAMLSIGGVKGVEIGDGFGITDLRGSQANDPIGPGGLESNHCGGLLGGISTGGPIRIRLAVKPTASIAKPQRTTDDQGNEATIQVEGRHDPCLCPRILPVAEAMAAFVLADAVVRRRATGPDW